MKTNENNNYDLTSFSKPLYVYDNTDTRKSSMFLENKNKMLVYHGVNKINKKSYVGSTSDFAARFYKYYNVKHLISRETPIHLALLKHGYSNFMLEVLEYCNKEELVSRKQYYIDNIKPSYNVLKIAHSSLGFKHSKETLDLFKQRKVSDNTRKSLSASATGRVLTDTDKEKISIAKAGRAMSEETKEKISESITSLVGVPVIVEDVSSNISTEFVNITKAAAFLDVSRTAVKKSLDSEKLLKKVYRIYYK